MRRLDGITQSSLTKQLRELERDGFLHRKVYGEVPPRVEYSLTELGQSFQPILNQMLQWSAERPHQAMVPLTRGRTNEKAPVAVRQRALCAEFKGSCLQSA